LLAATQGDLTQHSSSAAAAWWILSIYSHRLF